MSETIFYHGLEDDLRHLELARPPMHAANAGEAPALLEQEIRAIHELIVRQRSQKAA